MIDDDGLWRIFSVFFGIVAAVFMFSWLVWWLLKLFL